jgi:hypothetical protein
MHLYTAMCPMVPDLYLSVEVGCHVSSNFGTCLPGEEGFGAVMCIVVSDSLRGLRCATCPAALNPASLLGWLRVATRPAVSCGSWTSYVKNRLEGLAVQLGLHVPNAHVHVSKTTDVRTVGVIIDL